MVPVCVKELLSYRNRQAQPNACAIYLRHRPETTLLYQVIHEHWPEFQVELEHGRIIPYVAQAGSGSFGRIWTTMGANTMRY